MSIKIDEYIANKCFIKHPIYLKLFLIYYPMYYSQWVECYRVYFHFEISEKLHQGV